MALPRISGQTAEVTSPERRLWRAVLFTAIRDALGYVYGASGDDPHHYKKAHVISAVSFFRKDEHGLDIISDAAGLDTSIVRTSVSGAIHSRWGDDPYLAIEAEPPSQMTRAYLANVVSKDPNSHPLIKAIICAVDISC